MAYEQANATMPHSLILENRERLVVGGVLDVESFNEEMIAAETTRGTLIIGGSGLHIDRLSLDSGELVVEGEVYYMRYEDTQPRGGGFFSRLFK